MCELEKLYSRITNALIEKELSITTMESITSGLIASLITDTPGASGIFKGAYVTYSNEAKIANGVPAEIINEYGVYSKQTAVAMAKAAKASYQADIAIGVTGTSGNVDESNNDSEPGVVYYCIQMNDKEITDRLEIDATLSRRAFKEAVARAIGGRLIDMIDKKYKAILFDLDGTLLPMNMEEFTSGYFKFLAKKLAPHNIETKTLIDSIWAGTAAMVANDGSMKNVDVFWKKFEELTGVAAASIQADCDAFYGEEFHQAKQFTQDNPLAKKAVEAAKKAAPIVALATNPLFPMVGQETRMSWVGIAKSDFALVTCYESDSYCKPNPKYFLSVCERLGVEPQDCLLIGNDEHEDMYAATKAGLDAYLVTDTVIRSKDHPWDGPSGSFAEMIEMLEQL